MTALEQLGDFVATHRPTSGPARTRGCTRPIYRRLDRGARRRRAGALAFRKGADALRDRWRSMRARALERDRRHLSRRDDHPRRDRGACGADHCGFVAGPGGRRYRRCHRRGLRGHDPAWRRDRRPECALSRHLADLFRGAVRRGSGRGAAFPARPRADRQCAVDCTDRGLARHRASRGADDDALACGRTGGRARAAGGDLSGGRVHLGREDRRRRFPEEHLRRDHEFGGARRRVGDRRSARPRSSPGARRARPWRRRKP